MNLLIYSSKTECPSIVCPNSLKTRFIYLILAQNKPMKRTIAILMIVCLAFQVQAKKTVGIHLIDYTNDKNLMKLANDLEGLKARGINTLFLEVDYHFDFKSHPELISKDKFITKSMAKKFAKMCKSYDMEIIPQFQCLGHQSWQKNTWELLTVYPELDLTPGAFPGNEGLYCREWDVMNPKVNEIIFPMMDEIIEAFNAKGIHLGLDEVFLLGTEESPSTKGMDPAFLYGKLIREFYDYFSKKQNKQIYMWGDRLIDGSKYGYGKWEASLNGTHKAIDSIPKDIIICDWHYRSQKEYKSVDMFIDKGFKVIPCSWKDEKAAGDLIRYSYAKQNDNMLGHLYTLWGAVKQEELLSFGSLNNGAEIIKEEKYHEVFISQNGVSKTGSLLVNMNVSNPKVEIRYTTDGSEPNESSIQYTKPFEYVKGQLVKSVPVRNGVVVGIVTEAEFIIHKAIGKKVTLLTEPSEDYAAEFKEKLLVNGVEFTLSYSDGEWLGFDKVNCEFVLDMDSSQSINSISMNFHNKVNDWVHHPLEVVIMGSNNGTAYTEAGKLVKRKTGRAIVNFKIPVGKQFRYLKVLAKNQVIPKGFNGEGEKGWIFIDEVVVE
jgi:hypothetical protein